MASDSTCVSFSPGLGPSLSPFVFIAACVISQSHKPSYGSSLDLFIFQEKGMPIWGREGQDCVCFNIEDCVQYLSACRTSHKRNSMFTLTVVCTLSSVLTALLHEVYEAAYVAVRDGVLPDNALSSLSIVALSLPVSVMCSIASLHLQSLLDKSRTL